MTNQFSNLQQQQITQALQHEIRCAEQMLQALQTETTALGEHTPAPLEAVLQTKLDKMQQLELASRQRESLLKALLKPNQSATTLNYAAVFEHNGTLQPLWQSLMQLAQRCQQLNYINGSLVERGHQQSRHAMNILQGATNYTDADINTTINHSDGYNHTGQTTWSNSSHSLAQV